MASSISLSSFPFLALEVFNATFTVFVRLCAVPAAFFRLCAVFAAFARLGAVPAVPIIDR